LEPEPKKVFPVAVPEPVPEPEPVPVPEPVPEPAPEFRSDIIPGEGAKQEEGLFLIETKDDPANANRLI